MGIAVADEFKLAYIKETVPGTTPATPVFKYFPVVSENILPSVETVQSRQISDLRGVKDQIKVGEAAGGDIAFEWQDAALEDWLESAFRSAWATDVLLDGKTPTAFTVEGTDETGGTDIYKRALGIQVDRIALEARIRQPMTGTMACRGLEGVFDNAIIAGATYTASVDERVFNTVDDLSGITVTGLTNPCFTAITLNISNNLRDQAKLASAALAGVAAGDLDVSGTLELYLDENQLAALNAAKNDTEGSIVFVAGSETGKKYNFNIPRVKFGSPDVPTQGKNTDKIITLPWTGLIDSAGIGGTIELTRNVA